MVAIKNLLLFVAAASALVIEKRDTFSELEENIAKIHDRAGKIIHDMPGCNGIFCANRLKGQASDIKDALEDAAKDLEHSPSSFSDSQASRVVSQVEGDLSSDLVGVLHGIEKHEKLKDHKSLVKPHLENLKKTIHKLGSALESKVPSGYAGKVKTSVSKMEHEADEAIHAYS